MDLVYDAPWWFYTLLIVGGVALVFTALKRADKTLRNVGLAVLAVGIVVFAVSKAVETDSEKVTRQAYELVASVEKQEWDKLSALLDPGCIVKVLNAGNIYDSREQIVEACKARVTGSGVTGVTITQCETTSHGDQITTEIEVYVNAEDTGGRPMPSTWRLIWAKRAGEWKVRDIEAIKFPIPDPKAWFPKAR